ncbi:hypothetical protein ACHAXR_001293 [Thalassiosira sp. AJA248-18]
MVYHPDKYSPSISMSVEEATVHFQLLNNAYMFLRANPYCPAWCEGA